jgi:hypothetical protein
MCYFSGEESKIASDFDIFQKKKFNVFPASIGYEALCCCNCSSLIREFEREIKDEEGRHPPEVNKQLNDEKQSMVSTNLSFLYALAGFFFKYYEFSIQLHCFKLLIT